MVSCIPKVGIKRQRSGVEEGQSKYQKTGPGNALKIPKEENANPEELPLLEV